MFIFVVFFGVYAFGYRNGQKLNVGESISPIYRLAQMPTEKPVFAIYEAGGIVTMVTAFRMNDGRILPHNIYGGPFPYDEMQEPIGYTEIPEGLLEVMK
jgi:hypothetical protein